VIFASAALLCSVALVYASRSWEGVFLARGGLATTK
jgi:hypothetical protein